MLPRLDLTGRVAEARRLLPRAAGDLAGAVGAVAPVLAAVRERGLAGLREATERFDRVDLPDPRVPPSALAAALAAADPAVRSALGAAADRARQVHRAQLPAPAEVRLGPGAVVLERWLPVARVGLYVPGGRVAYPSSVVMNVVPAQVAGVGSLAVASPPQRAFDGRPHPAVLAACALLGVDEVYAVGGAQAVAMLAYGVPGLCAPVDVVTGPGNVFVTAAKRLVADVVAVDAEAGPTEVAVLADDGAEPDLVAADLVAQAEHDPLAACLVVTPAAGLLDAVDAALERRVRSTRHRERVAAALAGQSAGVLVGDMAEGVAVVDAWAPEHLEVMTRDAGAVAGRVRNAGAVFVGRDTPVSLGDYLAGSNHVLPTGGTAARAGGLSVGSFLRIQHQVRYDRAALAEVAPHVAALGEAEDLPAHVEAVAARLR